MSKVRIIVIIIAAIGILTAGIMLLMTSLEYKRAEDEYESLSKYVTSSDDVTEDKKVTEEQSTDSTLPNGGIGANLSSAAEESEETEEKKITRNLNRDDFPKIGVDFDGLKKINNKCVGWIYVDGAQINYPVVQCDDNEYYLHHTFEEQENSSGCIFMDYEVDPELTSWNTFVYGHNMKNGSMFGHLKNYINNSSTYDKNPYIFFFRPEGIYRYEIFSFYLDSTDSKMYYTCDTYKEYRAYLREATARSVRECAAKATPEDTIMTLVTCSGSGSNKQRFFVHGVLKDRYLYY